MFDDNLAITSSVLANEPILQDTRTYSGPEIQIIDNARTGFIKSFSSATLIIPGLQGPV